MQYDAVSLESSTLFWPLRLWEWLTVYLFSREMIRRKILAARLEAISRALTRSFSLSLSLSQGYVDGRAARPAHFRSRRTAERPSRGNARVHSRPHTMRSACGTSASDRSHETGDYIVRKKHDSKKKKKQSHKRSYIYIYTRGIYNYSNRKHYF